MKKLFITLFLLLIGVGIQAQSYQALDGILDKIESKRKKAVDVSNYSILAKKFVLIQDFEDHSERHILEFNIDNTIQLIELIDDKETGQTFSNIFTGDYIQKKNAISVNANYLEGKKVAIPVVYSFYLMNAGGVWYLKDINTGKRWIENNNLIKKKNTN